MLCCKYRYIFQDSLSTLCIKKQLKMWTHSSCSYQLKAGSCYWLGSGFLNSWNAGLASVWHHQRNFIFPLSGRSWKYKKHWLFQRKTWNRGSNVVSGFPLVFSDCILLPLGDKSKVLNPSTEFSISPSQSVQAFDRIPVLSQLFWSVSDALVDQGVIFPNGFLGCFPGRRSEK